MEKNYGKVLGTILTILGIAALAAVLGLSFFAVKDLGGLTETLKASNFSQAFSRSVYYNDHLYAQLGFAIEYEPSAGDTPERAAAFLEESLRAIDRRIFSAGIVYVLFISAIFSFPLWRRNRDSAPAHAGAVCLITLFLYAAFMAAIYGMHSYFRIPFYFPDAHGLLMIMAGVLSVAGGSAACALFLRKVPFKRVAAFLVFAVLIAGFLFGFLFEAGLYSTPFVDSFDYVSEIDPRILDENFEGDAHYDEGKNVLIVEGKEYPPEKIENADYMRGPARYGAMAFEVLYPYAGSTLPMAEEATGNEIPVLFPLLYILKGMFWIFTAARTPRRKRGKTQKALPAPQETETAERETVKAEQETETAEQESGNASAEKKELLPEGE